MRPHFRRFNVSPRRMACDKINADGSEEDTESFAEGERFVQENQSEHGSANDKHAIDRDDDAGWPFGQREEIKDNRNHQGHARPQHKHAIGAGKIVSGECFHVSAEDGDGG